jgi:hypothetical protein
MQDKWLIKKKKCCLNIHSYSCKYQYQRNILALEFKVEKVHDVKVMPKLIIFILKKQ